jgi:predicted transcriptional regulator
MSTLSLRLPDSLHRHLKELARREGVSINQFIATAVAEKMSALSTVEYLELRAARGRRARFDAVLAKVANRPADPGDAVPQRRGRRRR